MPGSNKNSKQSLFYDYIDEIVMELTHFNSIDQPTPINLSDCVACLDSLQNFIKHGISKTKIDFSQAQTLLKMDEQLFMDLIQPALTARLKTSSSQR